MHPFTRGKAYPIPEEELAKRLKPDAPAVPAKPKSSEEIAELSEAEIVLPDPEAADVEPVGDSQAPTPERSSTAVAAEEEKTDE